MTYSQVCDGAEVGFGTCAGGAGDKARRRLAPGHGALPVPELRAVRHLAGGVAPPRCGGTAEGGAVLLSGCVLTASMRAPEGSHLFPDLCPGGVAVRLRFFLRRSRRKEVLQDAIALHVVMISPQVKIVNTICEIITSCNEITIANSNETGYNDYRLQ